MEKAVIFSVIFILALLGLHKVFEWIESVLCVRGQNPSVLFYKPGSDCDNAEMIIRSLASDSRKIVTGKYVAVYIVSDGMNEKTLDICRKTADQLSNVFVGNYHDGAWLLKKEIT